jgi:putative transposase
MAGRFNSRKSPRLQGFDYRSPGAYFVTICAFGRECIFGRIDHAEMVENDIGQIVSSAWTKIPDHHPHVELDAFIVMPNHIHGIVLLQDTLTSNPSVGTRPAVSKQNIPESFGQPVADSLGTVIRSFKSSTTREINLLRGTPGCTVWQSRYYDHIVRSEAELDRIRQYIANNAAQWHKDDNNPDHV